jgi:kinesin family protein 18/19
MDNHSVSADTVVTTSTAGTTNLANVVVAVRIRPLSSTEVSSGVKTCCQVIGDKVVAIRKNGDAMQYLKSQQLSINEYGYDVVFDESSAQHQVFEKTAKPYISRLLDGQNVTVFAYGATGAGKTHTMLGNTRQDAAASRAEAGIIPNSVQELFTLINKRLTNKSTAHRIGESYQVYLSFLEVYNEQVFDLLDSSGKVLSVREDQEKGIVVVAGITEQQVNTYDQVIDFILQGNRRRKTEATMANAVSSRSHAVLQLVVKHSFRQENGREATIESKLSLIDLAGSERASATNNRGVRLQEGASINKSLLALANCINALAENSTVSGTSGSGTSTSTITSSTTTTVKKLTNVKYRDSKLTHLLKSSLEGNCNLIMIANINPSDSTYEDSHNTLKYANRAKNIKVNPLVNREMITKGHHHTEKDHQNWIEREMKLREENHQLKKIVQNLEEKVKELERFKHMVLQNGGMIPSGKYLFVFVRLNRFVLILLSLLSLLSLSLSLSLCHRLLRHRNHGRQSNSVSSSNDPNYSQS